MRLATRRLLRTSHGAAHNLPNDLAKFQHRIQHEPSSRRYVHPLLPPSHAIGCPDHLPGPEPLVVVIGFLFSEHKHVVRYSHLYQRMGCYALPIVPRIDLVIKPHVGYNLFGAIIRACTEAGVHEARPLLVHGMSVGAFLFSSALAHARAFPEAAAAYSPFFSAVRGLALDSPVDYEYAPHGLAAIAPRALKPLAHAGFTAWQRASPRSTRQLQAVSSAFHDLAVAPPMCFLYGHKDPIAPAHVCDGAVQRLRGRGVEMRDHAFDPGHAHCGHWKTHRAKYEKAVRDYAHEVVVTPKRPGEWLTWHKPASVPPEELPPYKP